MVRDCHLDYAFERGLRSVNAYYQWDEDGQINVLNRGYHVEKAQWQEAEGVAKFVSDHNIGKLKVSFFGPLYGSYIISDLDKKHYQYAFVAGPSYDYLWLVSRTPQVSEQLKSRFIKDASQRGFDTQNLIWEDHVAEDDKVSP